MGRFVKCTLTFNLRNFSNFPKNSEKNSQKNQKESKNLVSI